MLLQYYPESDMLYIQLMEGVNANDNGAESEEITPGIVLDFDAARRVLGIEIEDASKLLDITRLELRALPISDLTLRERVPG